MAVNIETTQGLKFLEVLQQIRSNSTLHNCCLESAQNDAIAEIMEHICDACIYLSAEETIDAFDRYTAHVIAGELELGKSFISYLLYAQSLRKKCTVELFLISSTMDREFCILAH